MKIEYLGHSGFFIKTKLGKKILVDPWLTGNPAATKTLKDFAEIDLVFLTHGHSDHGVNDAIEICSRDSGTIVANFELANFVKDQGVDNIAPCNYGGGFWLDDVFVSATPASHSSSHGVALGFVIGIEGKNLWFMGDTGYLFEFGYIGQKHSIDMLFLPIGGRFTMDTSDALQVIDDVSPSTVVPCHFNTFPEIKVDINEFKEGVAKEGVSAVKIMKSGDTFEI